MPLLGHALEGKSHIITPASLSFLSKKKKFWIKWRTTSSKLIFQIVYFLWGLCDMTSNVTHRHCCSLYAKFENSRLLIMIMFDWRKNKGYVSCSLSKPIFGAYDGHFSKQRQLGLLNPLLPCAYCLKYLLKTINTQWSFLSTKTLSLYDNDTQKKLPKQRIAIPIIISDWLGEIHELFEYHFKEKCTLFWAMSLMDVIKSIKQENTHNETMNLKERSFSSSLAKKRRWST